MEETSWLCHRHVVASREHEGRLMWLGYHTPWVGLDRCGEWEKNKEFLLWNIWCKYCTWGYSIHFSTVLSLIHSPEVTPGRNHLKWAIICAIEAYRFPVSAQMPRAGLCTDCVSAPGGFLSPECTVPAAKVETCCIPDHSGVGVRVQPLSSGFLCSNRMRFFLRYRQG